MAGLIAHLNAAHGVAHPQPSLGARIWQRIKHALYGPYADVYFA